MIGEIVAQTIPRCLQDKSLMAIKFNKSCTHQENQNFEKEDKLICGECNGLVAYEKSASIASPHEYNDQEIDDSKASGSKQAKEISKNAMKEFRKPLILWASPEFCDLDETYFESSPNTPVSSCLPENYNPKINSFESEIRSSGSKQTSEPHACLLNCKQLPSLTSSSLPENNYPKMMKVKIREADDSEASCSSQIFSKSSETQACHLNSKTLSPSGLPGNNHQKINYFENKVQETDDLVLVSSNYKQIRNQTCLHEQYSSPRLSITSSKHGEDINESCSKQSGVNKDLFPVKHEPNVNPRSTLQTVDNMSLVKSLGSFELQNLIINTFVEEVCSHFKANMIPFEIDNIKTNLHIFVIFIVKVFEVICKEGKLRSVDHIEMTRVTDFEKDNHGLSFNIEFSFKELIISFDNCHLHFLPVLMVMFPGLYGNYEPVTKKLEIVIKKCLIETQLVFTNVSNEMVRILGTNVYFLDDLVIKITSEDNDGNQENKIGEQYFEKYLQTHYSKVLKNILIEIFNTSVNYVTDVNCTNFYKMIQSVLN